MPENHKDYDEEPVTYCSRCYSLKIKHEDITDSDVCMDCGCTETLTTDIATWEKLFENRYGHKYVERGNDPRESMYFKMPISKLKSQLYKSSILPYVTKKLYSNFPQGMSKADTIILLFSKLSDDNRMDDLRYMLYDYYNKYSR